MQKKIKKEETCVFVCEYCKQEFYDCCIEHELVCKKNPKRIPTRFQIGDVVKFQIPPFKTKYMIVLNFSTGILGTSYAYNANPSESFYGYDERYLRLFLSKQDYETKKQEAIEKAKRIKIPGYSSFSVELNEQNGTLNIVFKE